MKKYAIAVIMAVAASTAFADDTQHEMVGKKTQMHPDVIFAGENANWKLYYDKSVTYNTERNQAIAYLLMESKQPRTYVTTDGAGKAFKNQYRYVVQRTDFDCNRGIYVTGLVTYFDIDTGAIIQEDVDGEPYKVNKGSPVDTVYQLVCSEMRVSK
jgi:hypothetical protein